jgi:hypothetical protein
VKGLLLAFLIVSHEKLEEALEPAVFVQTSHLYEGKLSRRSLPLYM